MDLHTDIRRYWDADAAGYDRVPNHHPVDPAVLAAWRAALSRHLPAPPARILDCGAGTGFLSLIAASLGLDVVAVDLSEAMLARLRDKAKEQGLSVEVIVGPAENPPPGPFDAVMERHLLWTLPDPAGALAAWRAVAPHGSLLLVEGLWGPADPIEHLRSRVRGRVERLAGRHHGHHAPYPEHVIAHTPLAGRTTPQTVVRCAQEAGWKHPRLERLIDVEWAMRMSLPPLLRAFGVSPVFVVSAASG